MKKILIPISALFVAGLSHAQTNPLSTTENYIYSKTYLSDPTLSNPKTSETVQYFDGLGRPKQVVNVKASPLGKDVVTHIEYDPFGRQVKDYLPVPQSSTQNGAIFSNPLSNVPAQYGSEKIYAEKVLENSPLERIQQQIQVGNDWTNKPVKFEYDANVNVDYVRKYETSTTWVDGRTQTSVQLLQYFLPNQLFKNTVIDEDGNKTIEFKNGKGQTLLVRKVISTTENADTYYVYNEYDQLAFVIPPLASAPTVESATMENLYYQYRYDGKNRLVEKKLPGKGWEYMIYDKQDRVVLTQDAVLRTTTNNFASKGWLFTKYDQFGRIAYTGFFANTGTRTTMQTAINNMTANAGNNEARSTTPITQNGIDVYYTKNAFPTGSMTILSVNYYDTYPQYGFNPAFPSAIFGKPVLTDNPSENISTRSLPVMSLVKNIEDDSWTKTYNYYDSKGRVMGSHSINHLGGYTKTESDLDFAGVAVQTKTYHKRLSTDTEKLITENFTYDHQNRLLTHIHQIDSNSVEIMTQNNYNELSQLESKKVGGTSLGSGLQTVDYTYNIRGWMTGINNASNLGNDLFGYSVKYQNPPAGTALGKFNGNISQIDWKTSADDILRRYSYGYDGLERLFYAQYSKPNSTVPGTNMYNEVVQYDLNGNIINLMRNGGIDGDNNVQVIDDLEYQYVGNQLMRINDASQNYSGYPFTDSPNTISYDPNGNITNYLDKGISTIKYNYLNLPFKINISDFEGDKTIETTYRADGVKQKKLLTSMMVGVNGTTTTKRTVDYLDGFQYTTTGINQVTKLQFLPTSEGYFNFIKNKYIYNYTDHLGNIRVSYMDNGSGAEVIEENNYYPFGLKHEGYNQFIGNPTYKYKYNGKEMQEETGMYDYDARFYMPDINRTPQIDPLAEKMPEWSPYSYAFNNPIRNTDPTGMEPEDVISGNGNEECCSGGYTQFQQQSYKWFQVAGQILDTFTGKADFYFSGGKELYTTDGITKGKGTLSKTISKENTITVSIESNGSLLKPRLALDEKGNTIVIPQAKFPITYEIKNESGIKSEVKAEIPVRVGTITVKNTTLSGVRNSSKTGITTNASNTTKVIYGIGDNGIVGSVKVEKKSTTYSLGLQAEKKVNIGGKNYIKVGTSGTINVKKNRN